MGEGAMVAVVTSVLTDEMVKAGEALLEALDGAELEITAALWLLEEESRSWRLVLASRQFAHRGPTKLYSLVRDSQKNSAQPIPLENIYLVSPEHPLVQMLSMIVATGPGVSGIRMTDNTINGRHIEDAYVYRLLRSAA